MHITAYFTTTFVRLVQFCAQHHYGTSPLVLQHSSLYMRMLCIALNNVQKHSQNGPDEHNYDAQINCMHPNDPILHEHLVHIVEVGLEVHPKCIENQIYTTSFLIGPGQ